jgi:DNA-binding NtrC family response regulator
MPVVTIDAVGPDEPVRATLEEGEALLIGREPEAAAIPAALYGPERAAPGALVLPSMGVSANHALVRCEGGRLYVCDLGSRNGTWMRLAPGHAVAAPPGVGVTLRLTRSPQAPRGAPEPDEPEFKGRADYAAAVARSVSRWLQGRGVEAEVRATDEGGGPAVVTIPLASGATLHIEPRHTVDADGLQNIEALWPWVTRQNMAFLAEEETRVDGMILASPQIRRAHRLAVETARRGIPSVMFLGPSGAGKERLARTYHRHLDRGGPFVALNCALLDRSTARADLFGAEVGAYTGCVKARIGAVERAHRGTLFLDEIGEMPAEVQGLLLRFLDGDGEFERMGGDGRSRHADVRIACATNRDLREDALRGAFRKDLWWRLGVQVIEVPPLGSRFDDVLAYLRATRLGSVSAYEALQPAGLALLGRHAWEGNFRELRNCVLRLPPASRPGEIGEEVLREALAAGALSPVEEPRRERLTPASVPPGAGGWGDLLRLAAEAFAEDHDRASPSSWSDISTFVEQYLKPVALQRMAEVAASDGVAQPSREVAQLLQADTKTLAKHLRRYADRFAR